jgi:predicted nucleic acid-binding protein
MIWVIDASVAVRWFIETENHPNADAVLERVVQQAGSFAVPELFAFEVYAVLCRIHPKASEVFEECLMPVLEGGIYRQPMTSELAHRADTFVKKGLTGYDACYAALAADLKGCWVTFDEKAHERIRKFKVSHSLMHSLPENW